MKVASIADRWKGERPWASIENLLLFSWPAALESYEGGTSQRLPNVSVLALLLRNAYFLPVGANLPPRLIPSLLAASDSAIGLHLSQNSVFAQHYDDS